MVNISGELCYAAFQSGLPHPGCLLTFKCTECTAVHTHTHTPSLRLNCTLWNLFVLSSVQGLSLSLNLPTVASQAVHKLISLPICCLLQVQELRCLVLVETCYCSCALFALQGNVEPGWLTHWCLSHYFVLSNYAIPQTLPWMGCQCLLYPSLTVCFFLSFPFLLFVLSFRFVSELVQYSLWAPSALRSLPILTPELFERCPWARPFSEHIQHRYCFRFFRLVMTEADSKKTRVTWDPDRMPKCAPSKVRYALVQTSRWPDLTCAVRCSPQLTGSCT